MELLTVENLILVIISLVQTITLYFFKDFKVRIEDQEKKTTQLTLELAINKERDESRVEAIGELKSDIKELSKKLDEAISWMQKRK